MNLQEYTTSTDSQEEEVVTKKSKAELFRKKHGYSLTMAKNMKRKRKNTVAEYRSVYKERQLKEKIKKAAKKLKVRAGKKSPDKKK